MGIFDFFSRPKVTALEAPVIQYSVKPTQPVKPKRTYEQDETTTTPPQTEGLYFWKKDRNDKWKIVSVFRYNSRMFQFFYCDTTHLMGLNWIGGIWSKKNIPFPREKKVKKK